MTSSFHWFWSKTNAHRGTPVVVKIENHNWSMVDPFNADDILVQGKGRVRGRGRGKNAKQLTWVLLSKAHKAAGCLVSIASAMLTLAAAIRRRVAAGNTDQNQSLKSRRFYSCINVFLWISVLLLVFELSAYFKGWDLTSGSLRMEEYLKFTELAVKDLFDSVYRNWVLIRVKYLAPPLQFTANACIVLFMIQSLDRLVMCLGCFWIKFKKIKPELKQPQQTDVELGNGGYFPMILVQIPMCNEKEVET